MKRTKVDRKKEVFSTDKNKKSPQENSWVCGQPKWSECKEFTSSLVSTSHAFACFWAFMPVFLASNVLDLLLKCKWMRYEHTLQERSKDQQADPAVRHASFGFRFCHGTSSGGNSAYLFLKRCANIYLPKSLRKLSEVACVKRLAKGWICNRCSIHVSSVYLKLQVVKSVLLLTIRPLEWNGINQSVLYVTRVKCVWNVFVFLDHNIKCIYYHESQLKFLKAPT